MAIKAKDILNKVRYNLSDSARTRWTDERLLSLLNDAILDIAKTTTLFIETTFYTVQNNVVDIDISEVALKIVRAEYMDEPLPMYSFEEMDKKDKFWQLEKGSEVLALVYDKQRAGLLKQYPIVENDQNDYIIYNSAFGIMTGITYSDIAPVVTGTFGDLAGIPNEAIIKFYYVRRHEAINDINSDVEIDDLIEQPLIHYITGMALRDNKDAQNRTVAAEELNIYSTMIETYSIEKAQGYVRTNHEVPYRPMG